MIRSLRYAIRSLLNSPGFTTIALLTLALAIGVNSSMYTLMKSLLFADAPYPRSEALYDLSGRTPAAEFIQFSKPEIDDLKAAAFPGVEVISVSSGSMDSVALPGEVPEQMTGILADANLFKITQHPPLLGRFFTEEECVEGRDNVALITKEFWTNRFGAANDIIGKTFRINGKNITILGVLPESYTARFVFGEAKYFRPLVYGKDVITARDRREFGVRVRLANGVSITEALSHYQGTAERWKKDYKIQYENYSIIALGTGRVGGKANEMLTFLLMGLTLAILILACANLANLQLARANTRLRDLAIRSALGASRFQLIKHQLLESIVLAFAGGVLGLLVASWCNELVGSNLRIGLAGNLPLELDGEVLLYNALASVVAGVLFGIMPAWLASRCDVNQVLKNQSRGSTGGRVQNAIRKLLVVGQVALSLSLLTISVLIVQGLRNIVNQRPSWDSEKVLTANLQVDEKDYPTVEAKRAFHTAILNKLSAIPGCESAAIANFLPTGGGGRTHDILTEQHDPAASNLPKSNAYLITGDYFQTLGIKVLEGRIFGPTDKGDGPEQVIVNRSLATSLWPNDSAVGKRLGFRQPDASVTWAEVIGVVSDAQDAIMISDPRTKNQFYQNMAKSPWGWFQVVLRSENPGSLANDLRRAVADVAPDLAARLVWTVEDMRKLFLHNIYVINGLVLGFALLGLVIASVGLSGIVAQNVAQRFGEFGIRLALGATPEGIVRMVMMQGVRLTAVGVVIGLVLAIVVGKGFPQDVSMMVAISPWLFVLTTGIIVTVSLLATWFPARSAANADPMSALRAE